MSQENIDNLRHYSRKMVRELGILEIEKDNDKASPQRWHALIEISQTPKITVSQLSQNLVLHISTVSRIVNSMIEDNLAQYDLNSDRREKALQITAKGLKELKRIDDFSNSKIVNAFRFLGEKDQNQIVEAIKKYSLALEKSRVSNETKKIKILTVSTSRLLRQQIKTMVANIQKNEFAIPVTDETNACILDIESNFYYNNSYNFWYAVDDVGALIGCIALRKIDKNNGELKKLFVVKEYRGQKVAQALMNKLLKAAQEHKFQHLYLGTVDVLKMAQSFYLKYGFKKIPKQDLPKSFDICDLDTLFFKAKTSEII